MNKLRCILLVDDDQATNLYHRLVLEYLDVTKNIEMSESGLDALQLLECPRVSECDVPDIIFLDLNMPGMTGWEFLEKYKTHKPGCSDKSKIFILTTSVNPMDAQRAEGIKEVTGFLVKPLSKFKVRNILNSYFPLIN